MPIGFGPFELLLVLCIVLVLFGAGRLSDLGGALGKSIRDFRKTASEDEEAQPSATQRP